MPAIDDKTDNVTGFPVSDTHPLIPNETAKLVTKKVVVITPFGGRETTSQRRCILDVMRIKYIIENKVDILNRELDAQVQYEVSVCRARVGEISGRAFRDIAESDIVVALLTEKNVNVVYELAVRNLMKPEYLLIIKGSSKDVLPIYLRDMNYIPYEMDDDDDAAGIQAWIESTSQSSIPRLSWLKLDVPEALAEAVDQYDQRLVLEIQQALLDLEEKPATWPQHMFDLAEEMQPAGLLKGWTSYSPTSVVRINWSGKSGGDKYKKEDMMGAPVVCAMNPHFADLYDLNYQSFDPDDKDNAWTAKRLLRSVKAYMEQRYMELFLEDQDNVFDRIVFEDKTGQASVPLQFNAGHPSSQFRDKVFLPCIIGKRTVGSPDKPHTTYLLVSYIQDFWPIGHPDNPRHQDAG